jgi:DNA-binding transcriptional LysR family regulator
MEGLLLLVVGFVVAIPVIAILALVRTSRLRDLFDERHADLESRIRFLESTVANLHRELKDILIAPSPQVQSAVVEKPIGPDPVRLWAPPENLQTKAEPSSESICIRPAGSLG